MHILFPIDDGALSAQGGWNNLEKSTIIQLSLNFGLIDRAPLNSQRDNVPRPPVGLVTAQTAGAAAKAHVVGDGPRQQVGVLVQVDAAAPHFAGGGEVPAGKAEAARPRRDKAVESLQQCRLARSIRSDERHSLALAVNLALHALAPHER